MDLEQLVKTSNNYPYAIFKGTPIPWGFSALVLLRWSIATVSALLSGCLVHVTLKSSTLHGTGNILIGFNALCTLISSPFMAISVCVVFASNPPYFCPLLECFLLQLVPMLFGNLFLVSMFTIGVDRLLMILFSEWHSRLNKWVYLALMFAFCLSYSVYIACFCYKGVVQHSNSTVLCLNPSVTYQGEVGNIVFRVSLVSISLCVISYLVIKIVKQRENSTANTTAETRWYWWLLSHKMIRSLVLMVLALLSGYLVSLGMEVVASFTEPRNLVYVVFCTSILSTLLTAGCAPALYLLSPDYRAAFRKHFPRVFRCTATIANVGSMAVGRNVAVAHAAVAPVVYEKTHEMVRVE